MDSNMLSYKEYKVLTEAEYQGKKVSDLLEKDK